MASELERLFEDQVVVNRIRQRLPYLFQLAEIESSRAGKIGMQVGSLRERIIVALLIYKYGDEAVYTEVPVTQPEADVLLYDVPISIKTVTGKTLRGVKVSWTVDATKAKEFSNSYYPSCEMLLVQIHWGQTGKFWYVPLESQREVFDRMGRQRYIKLPKPGTNPRGVEITKEALEMLVAEQGVRGIDIHWERSDIDYDPHKRWVDYWGEERDE